MYGSKVIGTHNLPFCPFICVFRHISRIYNFWTVHDRTVNFSSLPMFSWSTNTLKKRKCYWMHSLGYRAKRPKWRIMRTYNFWTVHDKTMNFSSLPMFLWSKSALKKLKRYWVHSLGCRAKWPKWAVLPHWKITET